MYRFSDSANHGKSRLFFIDFLKALSIISVVSYHSVFVPVSAYQESLFWLDTLFAPLRFCVPIFLTISFLLLEQSLIHKPQQSNWLVLRRRLRRLAIPTVFWLVVVVALKLMSGNTFLELIHPLFTGEIFTGSYYLLILFQLTILFFPFRKQINKSIILRGLIVLQTFIFLGLQIILSKDQSLSVIDVLRFFHRPPFFYWFVYIVLGIYCYHALPWIMGISKQISWMRKAFMLGGLGTFLTLEYAWLGFVTDNAIPPFDYLMVSCILSVPVLFLCFASVTPEQLGKRLSAVVLMFSKYSLGIFCINGILSQIFLSLGSRWIQATFSFPEILGIKIFGWVVLLSLSLSLSLGLERVGLKAMVC